MYKGYSLNLSIIPSKEHEYLLRKGEAIFSGNVNQTHACLTSFVNNNNSLNGTQIQKHWFPQIKSDVFVSHSHKDRNTALIVAGWLSKNFGLKSFIDSALWGYADELLINIDHMYNRNPSTGIFHYPSLRRSSSHVHMMLAASLSSMIDKTECLFFLNTPNSIKAYGETDKTESPWLYHEILVSQIIEKKYPRGINESYSSFDGEPMIGDPFFEYDVDLNHLRTLHLSDLNNWLKRYHQIKGHALDVLYGLHRKGTTITTLS